jgi:DNA-binding XRE family transcriptional regulator
MKKPKIDNAALVKAFRAVRSWTQEKLARECECSLTAVQDAESGRTEKPSIVLHGMLRIGLRENAGTGASE